MRVLLIEQHQLMARPLKQGLEEEGFKVSVAHDGSEATPLVLAGTHDVIILDLPFHEEVCLTLLRSWRDQGLKTPVLLLTADGEDGIMHKGSGMVDALSKPFHVDELFTRLRRLARQND